MAGRPVELLEASDAYSGGSALPSPRGINVAERAERALEGVKTSLQKIQHRLGGAARHEQLYDALSALHALARGAPAEGDSEGLVAQRLAKLAAREEGLVRQVLPQLVGIACRSRPPLAGLDALLVSRSSCSHEFAMECSWALLAEHAPAEPEILARAEALLVAVERAGRLSLRLGAAEPATGLRRTLSLPSTKRRADAAAAGAGGPADRLPDPPPPPPEPSEMGELSDLTELSELQLLRELIAISERLRRLPKARRGWALQAALQQLDGRLQAQRAPCTWHLTPTHGPAAEQPTAGAPLRVLRVCAEDARPFSTKERVPYIVYLEVASCAEFEAFAPSAGRRPRAASGAAGAWARADWAAGEARGGPPAKLAPSASADDSPPPASADGAALLPLVAPAVARAPASEPHADEEEADGGGSGSGGSCDRAEEGCEVAGEEREALSQLSSRRVILRDLPRELSGSEEGGAAGCAAEAAAEREGRLRAAVGGQRARGVFGEAFEDKQARLARQSPFAACPSWRLLSCVVKANDELRQERFAMQLLRAMDAVFRRARLPLALRPYRITATGPDSGLIEGLDDAVSLDALKQRTPHCAGLAAFFREHFGGPRRPAYHRARLNFARSAAAYSIACYLLQIKDRHNGNIMLTSDGCGRELRACPPNQPSLAHHPRPPTPPWPAPSRAAPAPLRAQAPRAHRFRLLALQLAGWQPQLRERALQAHARVRRAARRRLVASLPILQISARAWICRGDPAARPAPRCTAARATCAG